MKRGFKKSLALLLAVFMTFGAVPFVGLGLIASAADLKGISLSIGSEFTMEKGDETAITVTATYSDYSGKPITSGVAFTSSDSAYVKVDGDGKMTAVKLTEEGKPVTVTAFYSEGGITMSATCAVTVIKKPVPVDEIRWDWDLAALIADTGKVYHFANFVKDEKHPENDPELVPALYRVFPENADDKSAKLTCSPEGMLDIDNDAMTFTVRPLPEGIESKTVTLTLTANGAGEKCKPVSKSIEVFKDVPIIGVKWTFAKGSSGKTAFAYYEKDSNNKKVAKYYIMPTELGDPYADYKFEATPKPGLPKNGNYLQLCDVTFESSDERVIRFDEGTGRLIPVGNGEATLTVTVKTKTKVYKDDTAIGVVTNSPYTPISKVKIGYDEKNTDVDAVTYDSDSNRLTLLFAGKIQLVAKLNKAAQDNPQEEKDATLDVKPIEVELDTGEVIKTVSPIVCTWKSDDEDIATVDKNGLVVAGSKAGTATITVTINDNGHKYVGEIKFRSKMPWWEVLVAVLMCLFTGKWSKIPKYFGMLFN